MVKYTTDGPLISATRINRFEPDPIWRKLRDAGFELYQAV